MRVIWSTYKKIRIGILRAVPWSFMVSRVTTGVTQIVFPYFIYVYFMKGNLNSEFSQYADGADYMTYIVLGSALNVLAVSTLMNIGRALITELREGTLEMLLLAPASRNLYFLGCLLEQTTRALIEFVTVILAGVALGAKLRALLSLSAFLSILLAVFGFFCMGIFLSGIMLYTRDTSRYIHHTEYAVYYDEPDLWNRISDSVFTKVGTVFCANISINPGGNLVSEYRHRASVYGG